MIENLIGDLVVQYWFSDSPPSLDFNREIVVPDSKFPDGALGIRVDDDFWVVAVLPLKYRHYTLEEIVATLWPEYLKEATFSPDSGSHEQELYFKDVVIEREKAHRIEIEKRLREATADIERLTAGRPGLERPRNRSRAQMSVRYWIDQYENLLSATAHPFVDNADQANVAVCSSCGLLRSDRVHDKKYIGRRHDVYFPPIGYLNDGS